MACERLCGLENSENSENSDAESAGRPFGRFALPAVAMVTFFVACYSISVVISDGEAHGGRDKYATSRACPSCATCPTPSARLAACGSPPNPKR